MNILTALVCMLMQRVHIIQTHSWGWSIGSADRREVTAAIQQQPAWPHRRPWEVHEGSSAADRHAAGTAARQADDVVKRPSGSGSGTPSRCARRSAAAWTHQGSRPHKNRFWFKGRPRSWRIEYRPTARRENQIGVVDPPTAVVLIGCWARGSNFAQWVSCEL